jgi:hypothetical protein
VLGIVIGDRAIMTRPKRLKLKEKEGRSNIS